MLFPDAHSRNIPEPIELACLRHLRDLKADCNNLTSLGGLGRTTTLIKLSVKGNCLTEVDFNDCSWSRVETLDLSGNSLRLVVGLGALPALVSLNLGEWQIRPSSAGQKIRSRGEPAVSERGSRTLRSSIPGPNALGAPSWIAVIGYPA